MDQPQPKRQQTDCDAQLEPQPEHNMLKELFGECNFINQALQDIKKII